MSERVRDGGNTSSDGVINAKRRWSTPIVIGARTAKTEKNFNTVETSFITYGPS
ncbi:hypothetical protein AB5I39_12245 [Sphingomonas sp. MMS24-J45]|uniref:hypothetical protein n=1 Tax=Sphingomonas sp. MMS24-J45 TaxID=3238806 RepID=UPI00384C5709